MALALAGATSSLSTDRSAVLLSPNPTNHDPIVSAVWKQYAKRWVPSTPARDIEIDSQGCILLADDAANSSLGTRRSGTQRSWSASPTGSVYPRQPMLSVSSCRVLTWSAG